MNEKLVRAPATKGAAVGFIINIVLGNFWWVSAILGKPMPGWFFDVFLGVSVWILFCCGWFFVTKYKLSKETEAS